MLNTVVNVGVVLDAFTRERPEWGVTELAQATGLPKSNIHALVASLVEIGLLARTPQKRYRLGWRLLILSDRMQSGTRLKARALPEMRHLAADLKEAVFLAVPVGAHALYIARAEGMHPTVRIAGARVGTELPMYCTAVGKVFLADLERDEALDLLSGTELKARTEFTFTSADALLDTLSQVRSEGVGYDRRECVTDACCIAVPLFDVGRHVAATLSVSMPAYRFERLASHIAARLVESAERVNDVIANGEPSAPEVLLATG